MNTVIKDEFKRWQVLPALSRPAAEGSAVTGFPECRASESTGPSLAKPSRVECSALSSRMGEVQASSEPPESASTTLISPRHD